MKVARAVKLRKGSHGSGGVKRRYTLRDMACIKQDEAILNSKAKRGEIVRHNTRGLSVCGCGMEGCFVPWSYEGEKKK